MKIKLSKIPLSIKILAGMAIGIIFGLMAVNFGWAKFTSDWIAPFGEIFVRLLKLIAIPLILASLIKGISDLHSTAGLSKMGLKTISFYIATTILAVSLGIGIARVVKPGNYFPAEKQQEVLDEARKMAREDLKETSVTQLLMMMMKQQTDDAKADAKFFREMAVSGSSMGGAPRRDPQNEAYDQVVSSLKRENEHLEQQLRKVRNDAEDDMRRIRNNAESDARAARQRIDDLEKDLANTRQEVHRLTGDLQKAKIEADVQKMMSSSGLKESGGDMEKKMAMIKSIIESIGPVALPLLGQIMSSMGGAAPGMPPGDMSGGSLPQT